MKASAVIHSVLAMLDLSCWERGETGGNLEGDEKNAYASLYLAKILYLFIS